MLIDARNRNSWTPCKRQPKEISEGLAAAVSSVRRLAEQLRQERLIDFLASAHWLPSYAFPQDVMRLLVRQPEYARRFRLERDAEFGISSIHLVQRWWWTEGS